MNNRITIYRNEFRRLLTPYLKKNVGISSKAYPFKGGILFLFTLSPYKPTNDAAPTQEVENLSQALALAKKFKPVPADLIVEKTVIAVVLPYIVVVKEDAESQWTDEQVAKDIKEIIDDLTSSSKEKEALATTHGGN